MSWLLNGAIHINRDHVFKTLDKFTLHLKAVKLNKCF